ncbi:hypothetical protein RCL1_007068 [Eukaryota sp. TZLM3-RCL]
MRRRLLRVQELVAHNGDTDCLHIGRKSGLVFASGGKDKAVNVWTLGQPNFTLSLKHSGAVSCVSFDPEEQVIAAGIDSGSIRLFDLSNESSVRTLLGHRTCTTCLDFHPYGHVIVSGSQDTNIKIWDIRSRKEIFTYRGHSKTINSVKISPHGRWVVSAAADGKLKIWDITAGKVLTTLTDDGGNFTSLCFHPTEFVLASGSEDRTARLWDLETFSLAASTPPEATQVTSVCFSEGGEFLYSATNNLLKSFQINPSTTGNSALELTAHDSVVATWNNAGHSSRVVDLLFSPQQPTNLVAGVVNNCLVSMHVADTTTFGQSDKKEDEKREEKREERREIHRDFPREEVRKEERRVVREITEPEKKVDPVPVMGQNPALESSLIPQPKNGPLGLDPMDFLPQEKPSEVVQTSADFDEIIDLVNDQTTVLQSVLMNRLTVLKSVSSRWSRDKSNAVKELINRNDPSVISDFFNALNLVATDRCAVDLEVASLLLPVIPIVLDSKFEIHVENGLTVLLSVLRAYGSLVQATLSGPNPVGVDIERERRREKCAHFARNLRAIQTCIRKHTKRSNPKLVELSTLVLENCDQVLG